MGRGEQADAVRRRGPIRRFMAWLGFGPESELAEETDRDHSRAAARAAARRARKAARRARRRPRATDGAPSAATPAELAESLERAQALAAEAASRAAADGIRSLEADLERAKRAAAARFAELEGRLGEMRRRAEATERPAEEPAPSGLEPELDGSEVAQPEAPRVEARPMDPLEALEATLGNDGQRQARDAGRRTGIARRIRFRGLRLARSRTD